jgi:formate C-acetyltransferase
MGDLEIRSDSASQPTPWRQFAPGRWHHGIDVRDFIIRNVTPYAGDESFLVGPSVRTLAVWERLQGIVNLADPEGLFPAPPGRKIARLARARRNCLSHVKWRLNTGSCD